MLSGSRGVSYSICDSICPQHPYNYVMGMLGAYMLYTRGGHVSEVPVVQGVHKGLSTWLCMRTTVLPLFLDLP